MSGHPSSLTAEPAPASIADETSAEVEKLREALSGLIEACEAEGRDNPAGMTAWVLGAIIQGRAALAQAPDGKAEEVETKCPDCGHTLEVSGDDRLRGARWVTVDCNTPSCPSRAISRRTSPTTFDAYEEFFAARAALKEPTT